MLRPELMLKGNKTWQKNSRDIRNSLTKLGFPRNVLV